MFEVLTRYPFPRVGSPGTTYAATFSGSEGGLILATVSLIFSDPGLRRCVLLPLVHLARHPLPLLPLPLGFRCKRLFSPCLSLDGGGERERGKEKAKMYRAWKMRSQFQVADLRACPCRVVTFFATFTLPFPLCSTSCCLSLHHINKSASQTGGKSSRSTYSYSVLFLYESNAEQVRHWKT